MEISSIEGENKILAQITTKRRNIRKYEIELKKEDTSGNIRFDSRIYADMIFTLHEDLIEKKIGKVNKKIILKTNKNLKNLFSF